MGEIDVIVSIVLVSIIVSVVVATILVDRDDKEFKKQMKLIKDEYCKGKK
ncbi:hypothetical protein OAE88_00660 [bacterium]|nr:hypothetical protein [bacterium]